MNQPDRIIVIAAMTGIVAAGFTWFTYELCENIKAIIARRKTARKQHKNTKEQENTNE